MLLFKKVYIFSDLPIFKALENALFTGGEADVSMGGNLYSAGEWQRSKDAMATHRTFIVHGNLVTTRYTPTSFCFF